MKITRIDLIGQNGNDGCHYESHASGRGFKPLLSTFYPDNCKENKRQVLDAWRQEHHSQVEQYHDRLLKELNED